VRVLYHSAPINRESFETVQPIRTIDSVPFWNVALALMVTSTLTIWIRDPLAEWSFEFATLILAAAACLVRPLPHVNIHGAAIAVIAFWGLAQLSLGSTVYRYATWTASTHYAALAALTLLAPGGRAAKKCLRIFAWFGFLVAVISVLAYYTSPGKVLWIFPNPYPNAWGPFLNRDSFAQFLELALPVALWLAFTRDPVYAWMAAAMFAAGIASASRAGAALLLIESVAILLCARPPRRILARFLFAAIALVAIAGAGQLASRLRDPDPLRYRREMAESALAMIRERPWTGFGLGTFAAVYPRFARFDAGLTVDHAHNDWLEWTSEGGVGFAAAWVVLAIVTLRRARNRLWTIGTLAVMVHAAVDYPFARSGISGWIFFLIGMREVGASPH